MYTKEITAFGRRLVIGCDGKCESAFGINGRPYEQLSDDPDDIVWLSDDEAGKAPESGKTKFYAEGVDLKPASKENMLNRWCFRECERCAKAEIGEELKLEDWSNRVYSKKQTTEGVS